MRWSAYCDDCDATYPASEELEPTGNPAPASVSAAHLLPDPEPAVDRDTGEIHDVIDAEVLDPGEEQ